MRCLGSVFEAVTQRRGSFHIPASARGSACHAALEPATSDFVLSEVLVRSPRQLNMFIIVATIYRI